MAGHLALILHAHLPFVRHPEHEHFLEEDWLFEAITETYIPLLQMMQRLVNDNVPFKLTMSLTPTLCAMLQDELLRQRYIRHLDLLIDLAARERKRNCNQPELAELSEFYFELFSTRTGCCSEIRSRKARFMRPVTRPLVQRLSDAIAIRAVRFGARRKVIRAIRPTANFIATSASIFRWSIWARFRAASENFPG